MKAFTIYKVGPPKPWDVSVSYNNTTGIIVNSGNYDNEWLIIIPESSFNALRKGLALPLSKRQLNTASMELTEMIYAVFGGRKQNPFTDIGKFLDENNIKYKRQNWLSF